MNQFRLPHLAAVASVIGALTFTASPAAAQSRMFRATVNRPFVQSTTPMRITNFNSPHAVVPFSSARAVLINPFQQTPVMSLNSSRSVLSFNPFIATNAMVSFPNARMVSDPFRVSPAFFAGDFPNNRMSLTNGRMNQSGYGSMMNMSGGYGMPNYGMMGYGSGSGGYGGGYGGGGYGGGGSAPAQQMTSTMPPTPTTEKAANVDWPIGLRVLPPTADTDRVRQQLQADLEALGNSPSAEQAAALKSSAMKEIKTLRGRLDDVGYKLASGSVADARRFLDRVEASLQTVP